MMNGAAVPRQAYGHDATRTSGPQGMAPSGKSLVEGYRKDVIGGFKTEQPRFNPLNRDRMQSSALVDLNDPIQVHLLTETALVDSREYEILSQEEVDNLKKQVVSLTQRIEQARANLAVQSKFLDAATSMAKLYSSKKKLLLGNVRNSGDGSSREAEAERLACERKCEELATELFSLEKRLMEPQRRLFQHTAGILQLTHRASKNPAASADGKQANGIPGSPESLYTYNNNLRNSVEAPAEDAFFDDRSLYMTLEQLDEKAGRPRAANAIDIPVKSPIREQATQLREEAERLREENGRLRSESDKLSAETAQLRASTDAFQLEMESLQRERNDQLSLMSTAERKLETLNIELRGVIVEFNPQKNAAYQQPPSGRLEPGDLIGSQVDYMSKGLATVQQEQRLQAVEGSREAEEEAAAAAGTLAQAEERIEDLNRQLFDILRPANPAQKPPPDSASSGIVGQLSWMQESLGDVGDELARAAETSAATQSADRQQAEQMDTVLRGLWDIIQAGYASIQQRKAERRQTRLDAGLEDDDDDLSGDEMPIGPSEQYSLQAFSTKVQWLYAQATNLKEQKSVLKRQIKQQRELNNKSDAERDAELQRKVDEVQQTRALLNSSEKEAQDTKQNLDKALQDLEDLRTDQARGVAAVAASSKASETQLEERNAQIAAAQQQLQQRDAELESLQASGRELRERLAAVEAEVTSLSAQLEEATEARQTAEANAAKLEQDMRQKEEDLDRLNGMVAELKTEVTIAKAELDGAYGSRSQRAAEAAALQNSSESTQLKAQVEKLKAELAGTLTEFEALTKDTISAERERLELEGRLDDALAAKGSLEAETRTLRDKLDVEVGRLQEQLDAERLRAAPTQGANGGSPRPGAGASMLSEQFRATMKEERKKFQEEIRAEQAQRRKLEDELRVLKRNQGPGKSPLSPR